MKGKREREELVAPPPQAFRSVCMLGVSEAVGFFWR